MGMKIEKSFVVAAPLDEVWAFLTDPRKVASCLPGAAVTDQIDDRSYGGTMTVKVGPVTASYKGKMRFERLDAVAHEAQIVASGQETRGKGAADMKMDSRVTAKGPHETEVVIVSDVNVVGVLAQFGRGMIQDVSDAMFAKFTAAMRAQLEAAGAAAAVPTPASAAVEAAAAPAAAPSATPAPVRPPDPAQFAAPVAPIPAASSPSAAPPAAAAEVLDLGALGAAAAGKAAGRMLRRPLFWVAVAALIVLIWLLMR
jgi:carbon monoxide dehydrogenase subunit G